MAASTDTDIRVCALVYRDGVVHVRHISVEVAQDAIVAELFKAFATEVQVLPSQVVLWKPVEFLPHNGQAQLRGRLAKHKNDLSKFCINLQDGGWPDKTVSDLLNITSHSHLSTVPSLVVDVHSMKATVVTSQEEFKLAKGGEERVVTDMIKQFIFSKTVERRSPSQAAKSTHYREHQNGEAPILDGRYGNYPTSLAPPIEIYHPVFAAFVGNSHDKSLIPPEDLVAATSRFMDDMSRIAPDEHLRDGTFPRLLSLLNVDEIQTTAHHYVTYIRELEPPVNAALAVIEVEAELGQSFDPAVQGEFSYVQYWTHQNRQKLLDIYFCPSFIISIAGPWLSVCGGIYTTHPIVHQLSSYNWLGQSRVIDDDHVHRLARFFYALRLAMGQLKKWYRNLDVPDVRNGLNPARFYPLANKCKLSEDEVLEFCYEKPLRGSEPDCVTFLASDRNNRARRFVVKFVERYGVDAHRLLAEHGYAPKLLYHGPVWLDELEQRGVGSRKMIVMEFIEGQTTVDRYPSGYIPQGVVDGVAAALRLLHDNQMVHGDLREPNIMVEYGAVKGKEKDGTKIVDFDWAGVEGEVRYPFHLSNRVRWAPGVGAYKLIKATHDLAMLKKLEDMSKRAARLLSIR